MSKKKFSPKEIIIPTVTLLVICVAAAALLGFTNSLTEDKIASIDAENKAQAMEAVMPDAVIFGDAVTVDDDVEYSAAYDADGNIIGYAFTVSESGYGGEIQVMTGVNTDGSISKVTVLSADNETPGLGQNTTKDSFLDQFMGKIGELTVVKNAASGDSEIQAVTSATISSSAVVRAVNAATEYFENNLKGGTDNG
ncbi:MAG: RnfABCDGE type electron transport complex subunit G [Clostridiales bacterium]|nr:RnfABCDGE type electron transport complex subunit G [Clostridiales bacterium]